MNTTTPSSDTLVTIATFPEPASANVALSTLDAAGIPAFLQGANANSLLPVAFSAALQVRFRDADTARCVLASSDLAPLSLDEVTAAEIAANGSVE
ncbi:MAG: hypothetical protein PW735_03950 [Acidobacteriaceae bacterium]|nr:hypothetical protein [Acidobacteriaceae bacterium]